MRILLMLTLLAAGCREGAGTQAHPDAWSRVLLWGGDEPRPRTSVALPPGAKIDARHMIQGLVLSVSQPGLEITFQYGVSPAADVCGAGCEAGTFDVRQGTGRFVRYSVKTRSGKQASRTRIFLPGPEAGPVALRRAPRNPLGLTILATCTTVTACAIIPDIAASVRFDD